MPQTADTIRSDFDRIAGLPAPRWDHNLHYHDLLLGYVPNDCGRAIEIGCGTGEFTRRLARRCGSVTAVDLSPAMIAAARDHSRDLGNIEYLNADVLDCAFPPGSFDFAATIATAHHLDLARLLQKVSELLRPGGVFICLDLYRRTGLLDIAYEAAALPVSSGLRLIRTGRLAELPKVRQAYAAHAETDSYLTIPQIRQVSAEVLPGSRVRRLLLWRYVLDWKKVERQIPNWRD